MIEITLADFKRFVSQSPVCVQIKRLKSGRFAIFVSVVQSNDRFAFRIVPNGKKAWPTDKALTAISMLTGQPEETVAKLLQGSTKITIEAGESI